MSPTSLQDVPGAVLVEGNIPWDEDTGVHTIDDVVLQAVGPVRKASVVNGCRATFYRVLADAFALGAPKKKRSSPADDRRSAACPRDRRRREHGHAIRPRAFFDRRQCWRRSRLCLSFPSPARAGGERLGFGELYKSFSLLGLEFSDKVKQLMRREVTVKGFMARR